MIEIVSNTSIEKPKKVAFPISELLISVPSLVDGQSAMIQITLLDSEETIGELI